MIYGAYGLILLWMLGVSCTLLGTGLFLKRTLLRGSPLSPDKPGITVLKPLKGNDPGLRENLESFFRLTYPRFELIFCLADERDPARPIVESLISKYPNLAARFSIGETAKLPNPKVSNLLGGYESARYDLIVISDSNVRVRPSYLEEMVEHLKPDVGIVTSWVAAQGASTFFGHVESWWMNGFYVRAMAFLERVGRPLVIGKSMLFRRSDLNRFGGLRLLGRYLAEDFMAAEGVRKLGLRIVSTEWPVVQHMGAQTLCGFWQRHLRWGRLRKAHAPQAFAIEPLFSGFVTAIIGAAGVQMLFQISPTIFLSAHLAAWAACDLVMMRSLRGRFHWSDPLTWLTRELLTLPLWLHTAVGNSAYWRGRWIRLEPGGIIKE